MSVFYTFLLTGGFLIIVEVLVGFSIFWYLFLGLACILTALSSQIFPGWESALLMFTIYTLISVVVMLKWVRPKITHSKENSWHSLVGQLTEATTDILPGSSGGLVRWSGVDWKARLSADCDEKIISKGETVMIGSVSGTTLFVKPASSETSTAEPDSKQAQ